MSAAYTSLTVVCWSVPDGVASFSAGGFFRCQIRKNAQDTRRAYFMQSVTFRRKNVFLLLFLMETFKNARRSVLRAVAYLQGVVFGQPVPEPLLKRQTLSDSDEG